MIELVRAGRSPDDLAKEFEPTTQSIRRCGKYGLVIGFGAGTAEMDTVVEGYVLTPQGLRKLGSGTLTSTGNKTPGLIALAAVANTAANPVGLIVVGGLKIAGAATGRSGLEGRAKLTADEISAQLKLCFQDRGWIAPD